MNNKNTNNSKHIVICCREWGTSTGRYARNLVAQLQLIDTINRYTILLGEKDFNIWQPTATNFTKQLCTYKDYSFGEQTGLLHMLRRLKPNLVHFTMTQQPIVYSGNVITTMHDLTTLRFVNPSKNKLIFAAKQYVYGWVCKIVARKSKIIITPSEYVKKDLMEYTGLKQEKICVTYEGSDKVSDEPVSIEALEGKQYLLYVGRPNPHKNLERLIEAHVLLRKKYPDLLLVLAGKKDAVYRIIEEKYAAHERLYFTDFITDGQLRWLYEHTAAYVFPSLSEGFGLPGLEAMRHGAPVVSSNATCLPEIYGDAAHYFDPLNIQEMSQKIADVLDNQTLRDELVQKGYQKVDRYSWRKMAEQTHECYERALEF